MGRCFAWVDIKQRIKDNGVSIEEVAKAMNISYSGFRYRYRSGYLNDDSITSLDHAIKEACEAKK